MLRFRFFLLASLVYLLTACTSINVRYGYDTETDFSLLKTYDWLPGVNEKFEQPSNARSFVSAVNTQLKSVGFILDKNDPDFLIATGRSTTYKEVYLSENGRVEFPYGSVRIEFQQPKTNKIYWEGVVRGQFSFDSSDAVQDKDITKGVQKLLSEFPPN